MQALEDGCSMSVKDGGYRECPCAERDECQHLRVSYKRENSTASPEFPVSRTLRPTSDGCGSDAEAEQVFKMERTQQTAHQNNGQIPTPLPQRKQTREERKGSACASPLSRAYQIQVRPERPLQVNPGWIWSKSLGDIPMVYPVRSASDGSPVCDSGLARQWSQENKRMCGAAKDSEAQWQDDFTKWKNRRRSTKGDLRVTSQDREHVINQMANGAVTSLEKNEAQRGLMKRDQPSPRKHNAASQPHSTSPPSKSLSSDLRPHTRALLTRSYATEAPFSPSAPLSHPNSAHTWGSTLGAVPASDGSTLGEETHFASLASDGARITTPSLDCRFSSQDQVTAQDGPAAPQSKPSNVFVSQISTFVTSLKPNETTKTTAYRNSTILLSSPERQSVCRDLKVEARDVCPNVNALEDLSHQNHSRSQEEGKISCFDPAAVKNKAQQAASVYKYMNRACSFSGSASLPRGYRRSDSSSRLSSAFTARPFVTKQSKMSALPALCSVEDNQGLLLNAEKEDSSSTNSTLKRQTATVHLIRNQQSSVRQGSGASLSTQASVQPAQPHLLPQPYSNLQHHRNKSWSSSPSNGSADPEKVDHSDTRVSLTLKPNSTPDFGFQTHWDASGARVKSITPGSPAELCRLCVNDEIVAVDGVPVAHMSHSQWTDKMASVLRTGELTMDVRRYGYKDWSACEENHHSQPGQSLMALKLTAAAPVSIGRPDRCEAALAEVSKSNTPTDEGGVMSGVLSDNAGTARSKEFISITQKNQKRRAEFFEEKGGSESAISDLQVPSLSPSSSGWSWDREEDRRRQEKWQEEQERLLQEQYQRDQERLEAEWQRAQQEAVDIPKSGPSAFETTTDDGRHVGSQLCMNGQSMKTREKQSADREQLKGTRGDSPSTAQVLQSDSDTQNGWADASCGFTQLSPAHRAKSFSTSVLADAHKQTRGDQRKNKGQQISRAEQDRQQILEEMKKRTQLLTDSSWIRQRSSSFYKEPVYAGVPMKRYESLDNLDALRRSPNFAAFSFSRPHSAAAGYCAPSRNSYSRYSTGAILTQRNTSTETSHHGSAGAAIDVSEEQRAESRFESQTGSPIVIPATSNSSPLVPSAFEQHD
uniref:PDZ domain-containing protein n=1 Tax=Salarias fasciatus TaxID=181472 RepID=A0A672H0I2_SALFA